MTRYGMPRLLEGQHTPAMRRCEEVTVPSTTQASPKVQRAGTTEKPNLQPLAHRNELSECDLQNGFTLTIASQKHLHALAKFIKHPACQDSVCIAGWPRPQRSTRHAQNGDLKQSSCINKNTRSSNDPEPAPVHSNYNSCCVDSES